VSEPPLNVEYWASLYPVYTDYAAAYDSAMEHTDPVERARSLWEWKGLNRSVAFESIAPVLERIEPTEYIDRERRDAIEALSAHLIDQDVVESTSLVTSAFLLHLLASGPEQYSVRFPIYDRRVWNAFVYLWRVRAAGERLYRGASQSTANYDAFCETFRRTCPEDAAREYERALFMFGGFVMDIPPNDSPTPIERIDAVLERQEAAVASTQRSSGYGLVNLDAIRDPGE
jgi:hypothetical protein